MTPIHASYSQPAPVSSGYAHNPYTVVPEPNGSLPYAIHADTLGPPTTGGIVPVMHPSFVYRGPPPERKEEPARRRRASKPKVKTGCITCKIRHVKCDETKPACNRCTSTGRTCDGYETPSQRDRTANAGRSVVQAHRPDRPTNLQLPTSMTLAFQGTVQERDAFHRFQEITIPALNGGSELEFWHGLVLRAGTQEPVIRQAILALGTLHEDYSSRGGRHDKNLIKQPTYRRALLLYNSALRQVNERIASSTEDTTKIAVIASILFTCFEILRRNDMTAIVHYRSGMNMLMGHMTSKKNGPVSVEPSADQNRVLIKHIPQDELDVLLRVFARYDVQACTFAKPRAEPLALDNPPIASSNVTLKDVRYHLDNLLVASYQLISTDGGMYRYWTQAAVPADWREHVEQQVKMFERWSESLEAFFEASEVRLPPADAKSLLGLRLQIKVAIIRLKTSFNAGPESTFDAYRVEFEDMVTGAERVTQSLGLFDADPLEKESTPFTMELGIIYPLFYVATKCRDHRLRKRAIAQLRKAGKEGVWDGPVMAVLAKRMMQIEESGLISGQTVPERNRIHRITKNVDYDSRRIMVEMTRAHDSSWESWESIREPIPF